MPGRWVRQYGPGAVARRGRSQPPYEGMIASPDGRAWMWPNRPHRPVGR